MGFAEQVSRVKACEPARVTLADETETGGKDMDKTKREVSRFEWDERTAPRLIRNEELICRDCRHRSEKSGICGKYPQGKPGSVFNSQRWCGEYSPEPE